MITDVLLQPDLRLKSGCASTESEKGILGTRTVALPVQPRQKTKGRKWQAEKEEIKKKRLQVRDVKQKKIWIVKQTSSFDWTSVLNMGDVLTRNPSWRLTESSPLPLGLFYLVSSFQGKISASFRRKVERKHWWEAAWQELSCSSCRSWVMEFHKALDSDQCFCFPYEMRLGSWDKYPLCWWQCSLSMKAESEQLVELSGGSLRWPLTSSFLMQTKLSSPLLLYIFSPQLSISRRVLPYQPGPASGVFMLLVGSPGAWRHVWP